MESSVRHSSSVLRSSPVLHSESYTFDPRPFHPLVSSIKRYYLTPSPGIRDGLTLIFASGGGFPKELWEPVIEDLLDVVGKSQTGNSKIKIRELWALDAPNSGDSALLNEDIMQWGYEPCTYGYAANVPRPHTSLVFEQFDGTSMAEVYMPFLAD